VTAGAAGTGASAGATTAGGCFAGGAPEHAPAKIRSDPTT
jgi:hypothetical protein